MSTTTNRRKTRSALTDAENDAIVIVMSLRVLAERWRHYQRKWGKRPQVEQLTFGEDDVLTLICGDPDCPDVGHTFTVPAPKGA